MSTLGHIWTAQSCMDKQKWNSLKLLLESCQAKNRQERLLAICLFMRCICENNATFWTISVWIAKITFYVSNFFFFFFFEVLVSSLYRVFAFSSALWLQGQTWTFFRHFFLLYIILIRTCTVTCCATWKHENFIKLTKGRTLLKHICLNDFMPPVSFYAPWKTGN